MNNGNINFPTGSTTLSVGLVMGALFLGTGGSSVPSNLILDRGNYSQAIITNDNLNLNDVIKDEGNGNTLEFQRLSAELFATYGFTIGQYSKIMRVTRATIYKWHNLNAPMNKVQSKNRDRLKQLNDSLFAIKVDRKGLLGKWLSNPLDSNASLILSLLVDEKIVSEAVIEQSQKINIGLHSLEASNKLDRLLGIA